MAQEFFINSSELETKIRELLPSQGGAGAGFDLSASTQIIPIIDLTESAEGSNVRQDLQTAFSFNQTTGFTVENTTTSLITNTGYWRIFGCAVMEASGAGKKVDLELTDGVSTTQIWSLERPTSLTGTPFFSESVDFTIFLGAGDTFQVTTTSNAIFNGCFRQIAAIDGTLVTPT